MTITQITGVGSNVVQAAYELTTRYYSQGLRGYELLGTVKSNILRQQIKRRGNHNLDPDTNDVIRQIFDEVLDQARGK
ncbi:MAG: hypothetical protein UX91_C0002G0035 [Candidatus Amesbacteria bacterium GW2011_GWB1_47_19]|nr:MAG: hypothetical protein UW51_C0004G0035 [Candidatus Amesbacteria bacterium GW2011_GWA1_44_24]KKU31710.1 MAG: hypothetical protein UX46_C0003G0035 [Candidatus Amesbacteria bacterium GW2011_GWC1_46_24]KKU67623.1 MAG: hypothetical protein UX91_C0002G0035 [Candidatus Amesbacteria bacterium GW2011_GWB1_47_19]OGD06473.1 MAG: hypothetical protein A2379_02425 [Candidatus Amesbacteria bacterium RIFOXYB1_FULL_47_13]